MRLSHALTLAVVVVAAVALAVRSCRSTGAGGDGTVYDDTVYDDTTGDAPGGARVGSEAGGTAAAGARPGTKRPRHRAGDSSDAADEPVTTEPSIDPWAGRKALIEGVVKWPDGSPAADALVTLGDIEDSYVATTSAADGTFGIDEMAFYSCVAAVALRDGKVWGGRVGADGAPLDLVVTLTPPKEGDATRMVRVVGWDGGAVDGGHATVLRRGRDLRWDTHEVAIAGGRFVADTRATDDGVTALYVVTDPRDAEGRPLPYGPVLVDADRLDGVLTEFRLPPGVAFSGRVVGPDGAPVQGAKVVLRPPSPDGFDADHMPVWEETVWTSEGGTFSFGGLPDGGARLSVTGPESLARVIALDVTCGDDEVVVKLVATVEATITVTDIAGKPVPGADVRWSDEGAIEAVKTGADGRARVTRLRPGVPMRLDVNHVDLVETIDPAWIAADTTVVLPPSLPIFGTVTDVDGRPLPEAKLFVERRRPASPDGTETVYDDGTFFVPDMTEGDEAELRLMDGHRVVARRVASAGAKDVRLVWDDPGRFGVVFACDPDDVWKGGPLVRLCGETGDGVSSSECAPIVTLPIAGLPERVAVQLGPLADGRWAVVRDVAPRGVLRVPGSSWRTGRALSGRVTRAEGGAPSADATVVISDGEGFVVSVRTADDGSYRVPGVPTSCLTIRAESPAGGGADPRTADAGTDALVVDLQTRN